MCACRGPRQRPGPTRSKPLMVIRTCQYARRRSGWEEGRGGEEGGGGGGLGGSADKFQIVSIADERCAGDAGGVTLDWPCAQQVPSFQLPSAGRPPAPHPHPAPPTFTLPAHPPALPAYLG